MCASLFFRWLGLGFYLAGMAGVWGQGAASSAPAPGAALLLSFQQEQWALVDQWQALVDQGDTAAQLAAWEGQNGAAFAAQQQTAQALASASALQLLPALGPPGLPANASATLTDFLTAQGTLAGALTQIHNQLVQTLAATATAAQVSQLQGQIIQAFEQQHGADLQVRAQRIQTLTDESANAVVPVPATTVIPAQATAPLAAYLTLRDQLRRGQIQLRNQYVNADPGVRQAALRAWREQNEGLLVQLQQQAQGLFPPTTAPVTVTPQN